MKLNCKEETKIQKSRGIVWAPTMAPNVYGGKKDQLKLQQTMGEKSFEVDPFISEEWLVALVVAAACYCFLSSC